MIYRAEVVDLGITAKQSEQMSSSEAAVEEASISSSSATASTPATAPGHFDYIFGFGSIINTATHAPWLAEMPASNCTAALPGQRAILKATFGCERSWNFRSNTGFTALGITRVENGEAKDICGVLFRITHDMIPAFDRREVGYDRVEIDREHLEFVPADKIYKESLDTPLQIQSNEHIWVYIPQQSYCLTANEDHPILQSYVDTVMQGCLEWGGESMAVQFVQTTTGWSTFFLNDTPSSRRPWLYRKEYSTIDRILSDNNDVTHYSERKHPEEFASAFLGKMMRGAWCVPRRNPVFTGREIELGQIHAKLTNQRLSAGSVAKLEVAGMGGVGKTQICTEYCYRYFPSYYGLVIWLHAPSAESVAAGYRQLMADTSGGMVDVVKDKDTDEVVSEVKARLFRSKIPWLLVFDNLEDHSLLDKFVPNGSSVGHVLVTTRLIHIDNTDFSGEDQTMILGCFNPKESIELLRRAGADSSGCATQQQRQAAEKLATHLGHLPLALAVAAAYMRRCDVNCSEYLERYYGTTTGSTTSKRRQKHQHLGHEAVSSSLSLSLEAIKTESPTAWEAMHLLGWLGPDQITKKLLRTLFQAKNTRDVEDAAAVVVREERASGRTALSTYLSDSAVRYLILVTGGLAAFSILASRTHSFASKTLSLLSISTTVAASLVVLSYHEDASEKLDLSDRSSRNNKRKSNVFFDVFEQTDQTWKILKSFSLLVVKEGKGSMHRLLGQALRLSQSEEEGRRNLEICLRAVIEAWTFKPEQIDTWQESTPILEHVKAVVMHSVEEEAWSVETAILSKEAGVFSAMALNRFQEAQISFEQSLLILDNVDQSDASAEARGAALLELGRNFRYQGKFENSEDSLNKALVIFNRRAKNNSRSRHEVAATLHELGVLEMRKHSLDSAVTFLEQALELRRKLEVESPVDGIEADCASTLHQLSAAHVALKPPLLDEAERLLKEALSLNMQIGQRAATLKQRARVAIRRGEFDVAERSLTQALELYVELYGENTLHINVAAVKFQQGSLAFQREQLEQAWDDFSECLRARRAVYAYSQGNHLEVSTVLHELGCVALAQKDTDKACEMLTAEKAILDQLYDAYAEDSSGQCQRLLQGLLTNLTWLHKCAKERGDDEAMRKIKEQRTELKRHMKEKQSSRDSSPQRNHPMRALEKEALNCRLAARQFALAGPEVQEFSERKLTAALENLLRETRRSPDSLLREASTNFHQTISHALTSSSGEASSTVIFAACDELRDVLRDRGLNVQDTVKSPSRNGP